VGDPTDLEKEGGHWFTRIKIDPVRRVNIYNWVFPQPGE